MEGAGLGLGPLVVYEQAVNFLSGTVNLNSILQSLVSKGYATGNEWFLGIPLGSEVACGTGGLTINRIHFLLNDLPETGEPR
jgi:hypothetical protein